MTVPGEGRRIDKDLFDEDARFGGVKTDDLTFHLVVTAMLSVRP